MAKRYVSYQELNQELSISNFFKPKTTCGSHHAVIAQDTTSIVVIGFDSWNNYQGKVRIFPGETLGYDQGSVWKVPDPATIADPLKRVLLERRISSKTLREIESFETVRKALEKEKFSDGGELRDYIFQGERIMYYNKEVLIVVNYFQRHNWEAQGALISRIYVKKNADRSEVAEIVRDFKISTYIYDFWRKAISLSEIIDYQPDDLVKKFAKS